MKHRLLYALLPLSALLMITLVTLGSSQPQNKKGKVLLFLSTDCPVGHRYTPRLLKLYEAYQPQGVEFKAYFPNEMETRSLVQKYVTERAYPFGFELDLGGVLAKREKVEHVPTIVIYDAKGTKVYQGAIDDNKDPSLVRSSFANEVLSKVCAGQSVPFRKTETFGCVLMPGKVPPTSDKVNYAEHIAPIINRACVQCHRPGEVAPFSLVGYENARKWSPMITLTTQNRRMPPWKPVPGIGEFHDENRLSEVELETIKRWDASGSPRGNPGKEPKTPTFPSEWTLGQPDLVLSQATPYQVDADGADEYRHFILKTNFKESRWIKAMDVRPGNKKVVHHVIAFLDEKGVSHSIVGKNKDGKEGYATGGGVGFIPDGSLGGWAPGLRPQLTPDGVAFELKPGTTIVLQVHYHKSGKPEVDQTRLGLYFAKEPIKKPMLLRWMFNFNLNIPAGAAQHKVSGTYPVRQNVTLYSLMPHMHLLGKSMKAKVQYPDGTEEELISIDDWDFNWQMNYMFKEPKSIPAGSKIIVDAVYDNSAQNPRNPSNPPKVVRWGEETTDEMFLMIGSYTIEK